MSGKEEQALGAEFGIRAFHDYILALGSVSLDVLTDEVNLWIAEQQ
jgi:uncharacterized protein (DUF885 family)